MEAGEKKDKNIRESPKLPLKEYDYIIEMALKYSCLVLNSR